MNDYDSKFFAVYLAAVTGISARKSDPLVVDQEARAVATQAMASFTRDQIAVTSAAHEAAHA